jgi:tetratricopeptide (TPR) repeat protein
MNLDTQLAQLETAQLVRRANDAEAAFQFKHTLTQETVYQSLLRAKRREIHAQVARVYEAAYPDRLDEFAALLARHYAEAGDDAKTLEYATRAGDLAARVYANTEAIAFYTQALDAAKRGGASTAPFVHLYIKRGRVFEVTGRDAQAFATYEEMTEFARARGDRALELESLLLQGKLRSVPSVVFDRAKALVLADQINLLARELGNRQAEAQSLWNQLLLYQYNSEIPDAIRCGEQALTLARELDARELLGYILGDLARAYLQSGQVEKVPALEAEARSIWRELDNKPMLADNLMQSATHALIHGDYDQTIALTSEGIEISIAIDSKLSLLSNQGTQLFPYLDRGELAHALQLANDIVHASLEMGLSFNPPMAYAFAAMTYGFIGAYDRGEEMAQHARARLNQPLPEFFRAWGWVLLARYYLIVGNLDAAIAAISASQIENHPERLDPANMFGVIAQGECLLAQGEFERAVQLMKNRVTIFRQLGFHQSMHDALFIQAKAMRALGKTEQALELLHQARIESEGMQARRLLWQIYATLSEIEKERGNVADAENYRAQARALVAYIVDHTPEEFQASFLNLHDVHAVMEQ